MKCFYHSADLDGKCSAAIINYFKDDCEMFGVNYGMDGVIERLIDTEQFRPDETVYMVDYCLQPFHRMVALDKLVNLVWIDHHHTAIENARMAMFEVNGVQKSEGKAACELTWEFLSKEEVPLAVKLLSQYDIWNHTDSRTLPFQYGMRTFNTAPSNLDLWSKVFTDLETVRAIADKGKIVLDYEEMHSAKYVNAFAFETVLEGHRAIACNVGMTSSKLFDAILKEYSILLTFVRLPSRKWSCSIYSTNPSIHCGEIATHYAGGGHKSAAGFQCTSLPFDY